MNKKNIIMILIGILLLIIQFNIKAGSIYIDVFPDLIGAILIAIGGFPLTKRNVIFKKMRIIIIAGIVLSALSLGLNVYSGIKGLEVPSEITTGISTFILIYFTFYFTEGLMLEAKFQEKAATTRSLRKIWSFMGCLIFVCFLCIFIPELAKYSMLISVLQAINIIFSLFYCSTILTACNQLYMEGLPTKHMDTSSL